MKWLPLLLLVGCSNPTPQPTTATEAPVNGLDIELSAVDTSWNDGEARWNVVVQVTYENTGTEAFSLDKLTACEGGRIRNNVFDVTLNGAEVDYQGMMIKRAPPGPDGFYNIAPGASETVEVDLGTAYDFAPSGGTATVRFDHYNHFSEDAVQLTSEPIEIQLTKQADPPASPL